MALRDQASLTTLTEEVLKTARDRGAPQRRFRPLVDCPPPGRRHRRIGPVDRNAEGVVEMVLDATLNCEGPLTPERLFGWHGALFPTGYAGLARIRVGAWRDDAGGPMQVVSGSVGRRRVAFRSRRQIDWQPRRRASLTGSIRLTPPHR